MPEDGEERAQPTMPELEADAVVPIDAIEKSLGRQSSKGKLARSTSSVKSQKVQAAAESFAFKLVLFVVFVDTLGTQFSAPALVPLAQTLQATTDDIGTLYMARSIGSLISGFIIPQISDRKGRVIAMQISCMGSALGYLLQALVYVPAKAEDGLNLLLLGKIIAGLFSGTMPVCMAYVTDLSMPDMNTLRARMGAVGGMSQMLGIVLAPVAGAIASFGLELPFAISSGVALISWAVLLFHMKEAAVVKATGQHKKNDDDPQPQAEVKLEPESSQGPNGSVWSDINLLMLGVGFMIWIVAVLSPMLLLPFLFAEPSFGFTKQTEIATALGVSGILSGILSILTMTIVFPWLMKKKWTSDIGVAAVGCVAMCVLCGVPGLLSRD